VAQNRDKVEALRDALLERHELVGEEILAILTDDVVDVRHHPAQPRRQA
jgi:hypothetical protein